MNSFTVSAHGAGERLDRWLAQQLPDHSRSQIQRWIRDGDILVDGVECRASQPLVAGQTIQVRTPPPPVEPLAQPQAIPLTFVYEDKDIVIVDKPAGMVVHPAPGHAQGTLVNAVLHHCPDIVGIGGELRPGIVHRLDKETSGLIVVAKNDASLRNLQAQFKNRTVQKRYVALLEGRIEPESGRINVALGRHPTDRKRQAAFPASHTNQSARIREAVTDYETVGLYASPSTASGGPGLFTLVYARPHTGRTHQLRVHFAWLKHPIVGDTVYGYRKQRLPLQRLFLHAAQLSLDLPSSGERVTYDAPLPAELSEMLDYLSPA